jgi:hypothetical protein
LGDADLQRPTRCRGWLVADLLFHVLCDAQRALVTTQGHVLRIPDFLATEAAIHHLDLVVDLPDAPPPGPLATAVAVATMDGLLSDETVRPAAWSDGDYPLKATGRVPLTDRERWGLGEAAGWFPLVG